MAAKTLALRRTHKIARYLGTTVSSKIDVQNIFDRVNHGPADAAGNELPRFYAESEKCVRVLLEKLPASGFPHFGTLLTAGNSIPASLNDAYGNACRNPAAFQTILNATK